MLVSLVVFYPAVGWQFLNSMSVEWFQDTILALGVTLGSCSSPLPLPNQNPELLLVPWHDQGFVPGVSPLNPKSLL